MLVGARNFAQACHLASSMPLNAARACRSGASQKGCDAKAQLKVRALGILSLLWVPSLGSPGSMGLPMENPGIQDPKPMFTNTLTKRKNQNISPWNRQNIAKAQAAGLFNVFHILCHDGPDQDLRRMLDLVYYVGSGGVGRKHQSSGVETATTLHGMLHA